MTRERHAPDLIFMPPLNGKPWAEQPAGSRVIVCESWIKALILARMGYLAVCMNGVYGWCVGEGTAGAMVAGFSLPIWADRKFKIVILTDSLNVNPTKKKNAHDVAHARTVLASRLVIEGVVSADDVFIVDPPPDPNGDDWGVDDMYVNKEFGREAIAQMLGDAGVAQLLPSRDLALAEMNRKHCWINSLGRAVDVFDGGLLNKQTMADAYANVSYQEHVPKSGKAPARWESVKVFDAWFNDPGRNQAHGLSFRPGEAVLVPVSNAGETRYNFNLWRGFDAQPWGTPEEVGEGIQRAERYFFATVREAMGEDDGDYFLDVMASLVQHPEQAFALTIYLYGDGGVGKNFIGQAFHGLLGVHAVPLTLEQYCNGFNAIMKLARVAIVEELPSTLDKSDQSRAISLLKEDADPNNRTRQLELKGVDIRTVDRNCLTMALANHPPPWPFDDGMRRRSFIMRLRPAMAKHDDALSPWGTKDTPWWNERWLWMLTDGPRDLITALQARDLSGRGYDPSADAKPTRWLREALLGDSTRDIDGFILAMRRNLSGILAACEVPEELLKGVTHLSATDVLKLYKIVNPTSSVGLKTVGSKMTVAFDKRKLNGKKPDGKQRTEELYELQPMAVEWGEKGQFAAVDALRRWLDEARKF
jgi:hypothetical protein